LKNDPLEREIYELQQKAEKLGEEGNVDAYMEINKQIELLKQKKLTEVRCALIILLLPLFFTSSLSSMSLGLFISFILLQCVF